MIEPDHKEVETLHSKGACNYKENYSSIDLTIFFWSHKMYLFRFYPETQRVMVLVHEMHSLTKADEGRSFQVRDINKTQ